VCRRPPSLQTTTITAVVCVRYCRQFFLQASNLKADVEAHGKESARKDRQNKQSLANITATHGRIFGEKKRKTTNDRTETQLDCLRRYCLLASFGS
jgi:hypothetical protein